MNDNFQLMGKSKNQNSAPAGLPAKMAAFYQAHFYLVLGAILLGALLLRIWALLALRNSVYFDYLLWDEKIYHKWAISIANASGDAARIIEFPPLPAYVMALVYKLFAPQAVYVRILNVILGTITCYLVYLIGGALRDRACGIVACLAAGLYEPFIFYSVVPLKTSLSVFLFACCVYLLLSIFNNPGRINVFLLGIVIGLMLNVRGNYMILIPALPLIIGFYLSREKPALSTRLAFLMIYIAGFVLAVSPFVIRNYRVTGDMALAPSQAGHNLYLGNNPDNKDPFYRPVPFASSSPALQGRHFTIEASRRTGARLSPRQASSYWIRETAKAALAQPLAFGWKLVQKTLVFFNRFEGGDHYHIGFISRFVGFFRFGWLQFWMILPFGLIAMAAATTRSPKITALSAVFLLYGLTLIAFFTNTRYRLPLACILIPLAVVGLRQLFMMIRHRQYQRFALWAAAAGALFVIEFLPVRGTDDLTAYYNTHAVILNSKGLKNEAAKYWQASSDMQKSFSVYADLSLARRYFRQRDYRQALLYLHKIPDSSFAAYHKYNLLGDMMVQQDRIRAGAAAYEKSLAINSAQIRTRRKLIRLYGRVDEQKALWHHQRLDYILSFE